MPFTQQALSIGMRIDDDSFFPQTLFLMPYAISLPSESSVLGLNSLAGMLIARDAL
jgi:hypothetical protein